MKHYLPFLGCGALFVLAVTHSGAVAEGVRQSLTLCAKSLIPSLFPLFVLARLLTGLRPGFSLGAVGRLFRVSPAGAEIFLLGLCGGYPLGAVMTAQARREGRLGRSEAERLLAFSNNSGPAFILGAGGAAFQSPKAGLLLWIAHVLAAVCTGLILRAGAEASRPADSGSEPPRPAGAALFTDAVTGALRSCLSLCAWVCFFGGLCALTGGFSFLPGLRRVLALGFMELGSGIGSLAGWQAGPLTMALAGFLFGWGGVSVHFQTLGAVAETDIKCARHLMGRALCGLIAALISALFSLFL